MASTNPKGRPGRPSAVKRLEGAPRERINNREPVPEQAPPRDAPVDYAHLNDEQRTLYVKKVRDLEQMGMAYLIDEERLVGYIYAEWLVRYCIRQINQTGLLIRDQHGQPRANPLLAVRDKADARATVLAREFGFTPSSRQGISKDRTIPEIEKTEADRQRLRDGNVTSLFG